MRKYNIIIGGIFIFMWAYTLIFFEELFLSLIIGVLGIFILFLDDLIHKPLDIIGWTIAEDKGVKDD